MRPAEHLFHVSLGAGRSLRLLLVWCTVPLAARHHFTCSLTGSGSLPVEGEPGTRAFKGKEPWASSGKDCAIGAFQEGLSKHPQPRGHLLHKGRPQTNFRGPSGAESRRRKHERSRLSPAAGPSCSPTGQSPRTCRCTPGDDKCAKPIFPCSAVGIPFFGHDPAEAHLF